MKISEWLRNAWMIWAVLLALATVAQAQTPEAGSAILDLRNVRGQSWVFADTPLEEALSQLSRTFHVDFELSGALKKSNLTGVLQGTTLKELLDCVAEVSDCAYKVAGGKVVFFSSQPPKVSVEIEIVPIPEKQWKAMKINQFLTGYPLPTADEQETFLEKARKASGVRTLARQQVVIESGTETEIFYPLKKIAEEGRSGKQVPGYHFRIQPFVVDPDGVQLRLTLRFQEETSDNADQPYRGPSLFERPIEGTLGMKSGDLVLLHGASWKDNDKPYILLIALRATIQQPAATP